MIFAADYHLHAVNALKVIDERFYHPNTIWLGDIFDAKGCKKSMVQTVLGQIRYWKRIKGSKYLLDNHDALDGKVSDPLKLSITVGACGGSQIFWDEDRLHNYTDGDFGAGVFKRQVWGRMLKLASHFVSDKISDKAMDRAIQIAKDLGVKTIVCGHKHPKKLLTRVKDGYTLYVVPRGITELDI